MTVKNKAGANCNDCEADLIENDGVGGINGSNIDSYPCISDEFLAVEIDERLAGIRVFNVKSHQK